MSRISYYKHAIHVFSHKVRRALKRGHRFSYGKYLVELAQERQKKLARYKVPKPSNKTWQVGP